MIKHRCINWRGLALAFGALAGLMMTATSVFAQKGRDLNPGVLPINSKPHGLSYGEWTAKWWQWIYALPADENPILGEDPLNGQSGKVYFLAGAISSGNYDRSITIPTGTMLFFPIYNTQWDNVSLPPTDFTEQQLREMAAANIAQVTDLHATLDGVRLQNLSTYRAPSPAFCYTLPAEDNIYQFQGLDIPGGDICENGFGPAISDGFWIMLHPLPPGEHVLNFGATRTRSNGTTFTIDLTYHITVEPGHGK